MICTIYKNIYDKVPYHIEVDKALNRIKEGRSKNLVENIRTTIDKERRNQLKINLPSVCFSGKFDERKDEKIISHSGFICLDFDDIEDVNEKKSTLCANEFIYACWVSPSGNGLKALIKVANGDKHKEHFAALRDEFPEIDKSGVNVSRVCYESYDEDIFLNNEAKIFKKTKKTEQVVVTETEHDSYENFIRLLTWLANRGDAFVTGERNLFLFKLASACCRFGISEEACIAYCSNEFLSKDSSFSRIELIRTAGSAYKSNKKVSGTATFSKDKLINKQTYQEEEIKIDEDIFNPEIKPKDVIFGEDVKGDALRIYDNGFEEVHGIGVEALDYLWKMKKGEISLLSGIGNMGKSSFLKWYLLMRVIIFEEKFALFSPEDNPAHEFYHDCVEILTAQKCTPDNKFRPSRATYEAYYDLVSKHIFYVYPKDIAPTPQYVKERFLELIIKEKIDGCVIDPFNQMANDYKVAGGRDDRYLETVLSDFSRFGQDNLVYFIIVAHPKTMRKGDDGNYPCPDVFDLNGGAMWNNKMDNILIYHRPDHQNDPQSKVCEIHTKKIRRQRIVGKKGTLQFMLHDSMRRFIIEGEDPMNTFYKNNGIEDLKTSNQFPAVNLFHGPQDDITPF